MKILEFIEDVLLAPEVPINEAKLVDFRGGRTLDRKAFTEGVLTVASIGRGKTTLLRTLARAMLRDGFGGLVPVVKHSLVEDVVTCVKAEHREADLCLFGPGQGQIFNPFATMSDPVEAAALLTEISLVIANQRGGGTDEQFWREQLSIILRHLFTLSQVHYGRMDIVLVSELFAGRANTVAEVADPIWMQTSPLHKAMETSLRSNQMEAIDAVMYFKKTYVHHGDRLQGSLAATVSVVLDHLGRAPLRDLFSGDSTFEMNDLLDHGKICIVNMPVLDSTAGRVANALLQFCFCREAVRRIRPSYSFLIMDEGQELVTTELMSKMALLREFKVAVLFLTQNLPVLDEKIGETAREGLCGLMGTKIFGPQTHAGTREWAAEQFGKRKFKDESFTSGRGGRNQERSSSETTSKSWDHRVPPHVFAGLPTGETLVLRNDQIWPARWHLNYPGKRGTVGIIPDV